MPTLLRARRPSVPVPATRTITFDAVGSRVRAELKVFTDWLAANNVRGLVGEVGVPGTSSAGSDPNADPGWDAAFDGWYAAADAAGLAVTAWTSAEWGVGLRTFRNAAGDNSPLSITTSSGTVLKRWPGPLRGVNLAGPEFGDAGPSAPLSPRPGVFGSQYYYPQQGSWQYLGAQGVKLVRLPYRWERLQPALNGPLDTTELGRIRTALGYAAAAGIAVLLDMHNYARYTQADATTILDLGQPNPAGGTMTDAFVDHWAKVSGALTGTAGLYGYGLTNEPHDLTVPAGSAAGTQPYQVWQTASSAAVEAIRAVDWAAPAVITVCGYNYGNTHAWASLNGGTAWLYTTIPAGQTGAGQPRNADPNVLFEAHHYFDTDHSGTYAGTEATTRDSAVTAGYTAGQVTVTGSPSPSRPPAPVPTTTPALSAAGGVGLVTLTFTAAPTGQTVSIFRGVSAGAESATPIVTGLTTTTFTNPERVAGTYYYQAAYVNADGTAGPRSAEASGTATAQAGTAYTQADPGAATYTFTADNAA